MNLLAPRPALIAWLLVTLFAALLFHRLGDGLLWYYDEIKNAERAREFLLTGDFGVVRANFKPSFNKPPLHYWLTAATFKAFGEHQFAIRCWSALFAVGALALTAVHARTLAPALPWLPALSVLFVGLHGPFLQYARVGLLDMGLTFWTLGVLVASERATRQPRWWIAAGLLAGLGSLYKLPLPLLFWIVWLGLRGWREGGAWRSRELRLGLVIATALSAVWPAVQFARFGAAWWEVAGREEISGLLDRQMTMPTYGPATYMVWLLSKWGPFGLLALGGTAWVLWRGWRPDGSVAARFYEVAVLAAAYLAVLGLFTSKSQRYLFPVQPLLAVSGGAVLLASHLPPAWRAALVVVAALGIAPVAWSDYSLRSKRDLLPQVPALERFGASARPQETLLVVNRVRSKYFVLYFGKLNQPVVDVALEGVSKVRGAMRGLISPQGWIELQPLVPGLEKIAEEAGVVEFARP